MGEKSLLDMKRLKKEKKLRMQKKRDWSNDITRPTIVGQGQGDHKKKQSERFDGRNTI